jgi:hypothetical protein
MQLKRLSSPSLTSNGIKNGQVTLPLYYLWLLQRIRNILWTTYWIADIIGGAPLTCGQPGFAAKTTQSNTDRGNLNIKTPSGNNSPL